MLRNPIPLGQTPSRRRPLRALLVLGLFAAAATGWLRGHAVPASLQPLLTRLHLAARTPAEPSPADAVAPATAPPGATLATSPAGPGPQAPATPPSPPPPADPLKQAGVERIDVKID